MTELKTLQLAICLVVLTGLSACGLKDDLVLPTAASADQAEVSKEAEQSKQSKKQDKKPGAAINP